MEHYLVSDGYSLDAIRGETFEFTTREPARGVASVLGATGTRVARIAAGGTIALGLLASVETGFMSPVVVSLAAAGVLFGIGEFEDPGPVTKSHKVRRPGMTEREVYRRLTMSNEITELREEEQEKARKKAKRKQRTSGGGRY